MTDVLSQRGLNRATLARQYLLERAPARAIEAGAVGARFFEIVRGESRSHEAWLTRV